MKPMDDRGELVAETGRALIAVQLGQRIFEGFQHPERFLEIEDQSGRYRVVVEDAHDSTRSRLDDS